MNVYFDNVYHNNVLMKGRGDNIYHCIKERYWYRPYGGIKMIFILTFFLMKGGGGEGY